MPRTKAINIFNGNEKADLREVHGYLIENVQRQTLSTALKSNAYSGNPEAGSVEFKRFTNSLVKDYGTARAALKGDALKEATVVVNLDVHKEIVEEAEKFDIETFGVPNLLQRRVPNHIDSMVRELDVAFFAKAVEEGTEFTPAADATNPLVAIEAAVATLETLKNDYINGMKRNMIEVVVSPAVYAKMRHSLDVDVNNAHVNTAAEEFGLYHGIRIYQSIHMPEGTDFVVMADQSIAQPIVVNQYAEPEKIPLSDAWGISLFFYYGTKVLTPELVLHGSVPTGA